MSYLLYYIYKQPKGISTTLGNGCFRRRLCKEESPGHFPYTLYDVLNHVGFITWSTNVHIPQVFKNNTDLLPVSSMSQQSSTGLRELKSWHQQSWVSFGTRGTSAFPGSGSLPWLLERATKTRECSGLSHTVELLILLVPALQLHCPTYNLKDSPLQGQLIIHFNLPLPFSIFRCSRTRIWMYLGD